MADLNSCPECSTVTEALPDGLKVALEVVEYILEIPGYDEPILIAMWEGSQATANGECWCVQNVNGDFLDQNLEWHRQWTPVHVLTLDVARQLANRYIDRLLHAADGEIYSLDDIHEFVQANFVKVGWRKPKEGEVPYCVKFIAQNQQFFPKLRVAVQLIQKRIAESQLRLDTTGDEDSGGRELVVHIKCPPAMSTEDFMNIFMDTYRETTGADESRCRVWLYPDQ